MSPMDSAASWTPPSLLSSNLSQEKGIRHLRSMYSGLDTALTMPANSILLSPLQIRTQPPRVNSSVWGHPPHMARSVGRLSLCSHSWPYLLVGRLNEAAGSVSPHQDSA